MAFIFTMHSNRKDMPAASTLPVISEDDPDGIFDMGPPTTPTSPTRMALPSRPPWARTPNASPLSYISMGSDGSGSETDQEKERQLADLRNNVHVAKRGGWNRLALIAGLGVLLLLGLILGLVFGLKSRDTSPSDPSASAAPAADAFPVGSYAITTYLSAVTTNCTSNPATWRCYPYTTYAESTTLSAATFSWIIAADGSPSPASSSSTGPSYTVSSTSNPFSLVFSSTPLVLQDANQPTEHFAFVIAGMNKPVVPTIAITTANVAATCYFNQTTLQARLYTKMARTYPASLGSGGTNNNPAQFTAWPYAATIEQTASGDNNVPDCYDVSGNRVGDFPAQIGGECTCAYQNYGT